jgi:hypothetical protein
MRIPEKPFMSPVPLRQLLADLEQWPSPDIWPFVPAHTEQVAMDTLVTLLTFDSDKEFTIDEFKEFERWTARQGLENFLSQQQLVDIRDSLGYEIESLKEQSEIEIVRRHYDAILIRAINHYSEMDAFVSLKDWIGAGGRTFKGILADYN